MYEFILSGEKPASLNIVRDLMGHSDTKTTEIYLQATALKAAFSNASMGMILNACCASRNNKS